MNAMRQAVTDWKARQAGDETPEPSRDVRTEPQGPGTIVTAGYVGRPTFCSGGMYVAGYEDGKPRLMKVSRCDNEADWRTQLCDDCMRREREARERLREWAAPKQDARSAGRGRFEQ
jgi:hypothetical protein